MGTGGAWFEDVSWWAGSGLKALRKLLPPCRRRGVEKRSGRPLALEQKRHPRRERDEGSDAGEILDEG
jgi:hypothetical protein